MYGFQLAILNREYFKYLQEFPAKNLHHKTIHYDDHFQYKRIKSVRMNMHRIMQSKHEQDVAIIAPFNVFTCFKKNNSPDYKRIKSFFYPN